MIEYVNVTKEYEGTDRPAVDNVSLRVEDGTLCALLGPSGCGKTTLLRMTNRLIDSTSGTITIGGEDIRRNDPVRLRRGIGYVIQGVGLFPHRTVAENVATTLELVGWPKEKRSGRVDEMLAMVRLDPARYRDRYPSQLSGGEAQRVGVARGLAADPPVLLMDEPFGAVDPINREEIRREFRELQRTLGKTVLLVTHDVSEAIFLGDTIALMNRGRLEQHGVPADLLHTPATSFVRSFFGNDAELLYLDSIPVTDALIPTDGTSSASGGGPRIAQDRSLREALALLIGTGAESLIVERDGTAVGNVTFNSIRAATRSASDRSRSRSIPRIEESR